MTFYFSFFRITFFPRFCLLPGGLRFFMFYGSNVFFLFFASLPLARFPNVFYVRCIADAVVTAGTQNSNLACAARMLYFVVFCMKV